VARLAAVREAPLAALDARALELVDGAAAALLDSAAQARARRTPVAAQAAVAPVAAAPAVEDAPSAPDGHAQAPQPWRPPTGAALVALLETGITRFGGLGALVDDGTPEPDDARVIAPPDVPAPGDAVEAAPIVPVEELLYRGAAALARAREVRDRLRAAHGAVPDAALLAELYDLLDLAAE
jgi:hypothetical protein